MFEMRHPKHVRTGSPRQKGQLQLGNLRLGPAPVSTICTGFGVAVSAGAFGGTLGAFATREVSKIPGHAQKVPFLVG